MYLLLIGPRPSVMVMQDPYMALFGFSRGAPANPGCWRTFGVKSGSRGLRATTSSPGTADILETMQESLQGIRTVQGVPRLEQIMRAARIRCEHQ